MDEQFQRDLELAAAGDWEALGLDAPDAPSQPGWQPTTLETFLAEA